MSASVNVSDSATAAYNVYSPITNITYCKQLGVEIVSATQDGRSFTDDEKKFRETPNWPEFPENCTSQYNCTIFDLFSTSTPEFFRFRVKTMYPGGISHLSPYVSFSINEIFNTTRPVEQLRAYLKGYD